MVPSSFTISTITAAGSKPASRARSQPASVWPARVSTPPGLATSGKMCPGCTMSAACASRATAASTVAARPAEVMPGTGSTAASIETVKLVSCCDWFFCTISGSARRRARSSVIGRQIRPQACEAKKVISSGVTASAAMIRSPSFSRSSSSIRITMRPWRMSSMMSWMALMGMAGSGVLGVARAVS